MMNTNFLLAWLIHEMAVTKDQQQAVFNCVFLGVLFTFLTLDAGFDETIGDNLAQYLFT